jgi:hypothetical protein
MVLTACSLLDGLPALAFKLPLVEYARRIKREKVDSHGTSRAYDSQSLFNFFFFIQAFVEHSTRMLQKVYRGYRGRCRYRRVFLKSLERQQQQLQLQVVRKSFAVTRQKVRYFDANLLD